MRVIKLVWLGVLAGSVIACGNEPVGPVDLGGDARLRVLHTVASVEAVDVTVDGSLVVAALPFGQTSQFVSVPSGERRVALAPSGGATGTGLTISFQSQDSVTVITVDSASILNPWVLTDSGAVVPPDQSKLRAVHFAEATQNIDIWRTQPDFAQPFTFMFPFRYQEASPYIQSDPGEWRVFVSTLARSGGIPVMTDTLLATGPIEVPAGESRTVVIMNDEQGGLMSVVITP